MFIQLFLSSIITPETLNYSRSIIKNSQLQFVPSLLKEKEFNDTIEGLTIFVGKKTGPKKYENPGLQNPWFSGPTITLTIYYIILYYHIPQ